MVSTNRGSFNHYLHNSGGFVTTIALAIQKADQQNHERLRGAFPQMVAAQQMPTWDEVPEGFKPQYDAQPIGVQIAGSPLLHDGKPIELNRLAHLKDIDILYVVQTEDVRGELENRSGALAGQTLDDDSIDDFVTDDGFMHVVKTCLESYFGNAIADVLSTAVDEAITEARAGQGHP